MGSYLSRTLLLAFGYAYPAYECFKAVENNNNPEIHQLRFWCQYWVLVSILTVFEKIGDVFVSWLPLYSEVKLAFVVYLWYPKWKGTTYVYNSFLRPYVAKHETEIDRNLFELKVKAREVWFLYWHKAVKYGDTRFHQMLQCVSSPEPYLDQVTIQTLNTEEHENLRKAEMVGSSKASDLTEKGQQLEQRHLPVSSILSVSKEQSTTNDAQHYLPTYSTPSLANANSQQLQTSYKGTQTKRRRIWRIFKTTKPHKNS